MIDKECFVKFTKEFKTKNVAIAIIIIGGSFFCAAYRTKAVQSKIEHIQIFLSILFFNRKKMEV